MTLLKCQYIYWKGFNIFVRIMGVIWLIGGCIALFQSLKIISSNEMILVNGSPSNDPVLKSITIFLCAVVAVSGLLMLRVKVYYPNKIQDWINQNANKT